MLLRASVCRASALDARVEARPLLSLAARSSRAKVAAGTERRGNCTAPYLPSPGGFPSEQRFRPSVLSIAFIFIFPPTLDSGEAAAVALRLSPDAAASFVTAFCASRTGERGGSNYVPRRFCRLPADCAGGRVIYMHAGRGASRERH